MKSKILIIDDSEDVLFLLHEIIWQKFRETPLRASSVGQAVQIIQQEKESLAVIICDLIMPDGGGLSVRAKLEELGCRVPFFVHSAMPDAQRTFEESGLAVDASIRKCDQSSITEALEKVLAL